MTNEELAIQYQNAAPEDKPELIRKLWEQNIGLLAKKSYSFYTTHSRACARSGQTIDDLKQIAFFALCDAVESYDPEQKYLFASYLSYPMQNRFNEAIGNRGKRDLLNECVSLDKPVAGKDGNEDTTLGELQEDPRQGDMLDQTEDRIYTQQLHAALEKGISDLPGEQYQRVIRLKYYNGLTAGECGKIMGCSESNADRIEKKAIRLLRHPQRLKYFSRFHDSVVNSYAWHGMSLTSWKETGASGVERAAEKAEQKTQHEFTYQFTADK